jgi:hypothetical protein
MAKETTAEGRDAMEIARAIMAGDADTIAKAALVLLYVQRLRIIDKAHGEPLPFALDIIAGGTIRRLREAVDRLPGEFRP